ncbi:hypothetical protein AcV7_003791 [Taiwanofungus camphoratus]|nr:hypothetical protein AcV7_003791 [Antrodia cinnamomea]
MFNPDPNKTLILDGGLGTTLEDHFDKDISAPLWSAKPVDDDSGVIIAAHLAFLRAGADIVLTSTYQCAFETFERSGYTPQDATRIMLKSVALAAEAKERFLGEQIQRGLGDSDAPSRQARIALSLGPFGATLSPAHEFDGFYPPPYGPKAYSPTQHNYNSFESSERHQELEAIEALTAFHLNRLRVFATDAQTWNMIDIVAFETVPLTREIRAIRRAAGQLQRELKVQMKPFWISTVYPGGRLPEKRNPGGESLSVRQVVQTALQDAETERADTAEDARQMPRPSGLGINCTSLDFLRTLLQEMTAVVKDICKDGQAPPWLVVYPNRGDIYDTANQTWLPAEKDAKGEGWAKQLCDIVQPVTGQGVWRGLVVGGCCKTGPGEIADLAGETKNLAVQ